MMYGVKRGKGVLSEDTMNDEFDDKDTKRKSRNLSEKKRRDQFNLLVNELCSMVSSGGRKMDKSTVLKSAISFLKNYNEVAARSRMHEIEEDWKPSFLTNEEFSHLIFEAVHGFIIVFTVSGQISYASESIMSLLGYLPIEVLNANFYEMVLEDEQNNLYNSLNGFVQHENSQISFSCHFKCGGIIDQSDCIELVNFTGYFKYINEIQGTRNKCDIQRQDNRVFIGTGHLQTPQLIRDVSIIDKKSEFTSRHSLEWKFLFLDHRAPPIIGYLPFELLGTSGYDYYHVDDLDNVVNCHEALMQKGEGTSCYYRFLTKGQQWIWLKTRFYITYHQWNSKPEFIVCSHRVVGYCDVMKQNKIDVTDTSTIESSHTPWNARASQRSAESPCSVATQQSTLSRISEDNCVAKIPCSVETVPMQPVATQNYESSLTSAEMPTEQTLHADLQRKHAELQASIGQQQAELIMVSEQLLMARLGLLSAQTQQSNVTPAFAVNNPSGAVSSTTLLSSVPSNLLTPLVAVSSTDLFQTPDSNTTLQSFTELK